MCRRGFLAAWLALAPAAAAQRGTRDSTARDSTRAATLAPITVSASRTDVPRNRVPNATTVLDRAAIAHGRATLGLDESLAQVPGVYAANRYNFSLDDRISIRGFGARSAFAVRGVTVLLDGIPQTLPDGQGQLTNLELGETDRVEVLRGSASALFGNAAGGVISIWSDPTPPRGFTTDLRLTGGASGDALEHVWRKWVGTARWRAGNGVAQLTASRLLYEGERQHSTADLRTVNGRLVLPTGDGWTTTALLEVGDDPRADNPGSLTGAELAANPDSADAIYQSTQAGKWVRQVQGGVTVRRDLAGGGQASLTAFALGRALRNPQTYAYIDLNRRAYGLRASVSRPTVLAGVHQTLTAGVDAQWQRDDRANFANNAGAAGTDPSLDQLEHVSSVGPFLQTAVELTPTVTGTFGVRDDRIRFRADDRLITPTNPDDSGDRLMHALSGSAGVAWRAAEALTVYANVGTSFETPTTTELANRPDTAGGFNPSLDPQTATTYEAGVRGGLGGHVTYSLAAYQAAVRGELIAFEEPASPGRSFYRNAGQSRHRGVEVGATATLGIGYSLRANWTYSDFRYVHYVMDGRSLDGRMLPGIPPSWLDLIFHARPGGGRTWTELEVRQASGYPVNDTLATRTSPWTTADLRVGWDGAVGGTPVSPFVAANNLFDRRYVSSVVINATGGRYYEPAPGRNFDLGLSITLGS